MSVELVRRLLASGAVLPSEVKAALFHHLGSGTPFLRALVDRGEVAEAALDDELRRSPLRSLDYVVPLPALVDDLPGDLCRKLLSVPVRRDARTGQVDVAVADPYDGHVEEEFARHLGAEVRRLRASLTAVEQALARIARGEYSSKVILQKSALPVRPASGPPIPLLRRTSRDDAQAPDDDIDVLGVQDIVEQMESDGGITDELGQPILPLTSSKIPSELDRRFGPPRASARPSIAPVAAPVTAEPFAPTAPIGPFPGIDGALDALARAATRDEVIAHLIAGMSTVASGVGAFAVKRRGFRGIACSADLGDRASFRAIEVATEAPTVLGIAAKKGSYLGPLPSTPPHEPLRRLMKDASGEVATVLVRIAGRPAVILFATSLGDTMLATRRAEELAREASVALSRIVADAKTARRSSV